MKTSPESSSWFLALGLLITSSSILGLASAQLSGCTSALVSLSPCLSYLDGNSSSSPSTGCCTQLDAVASSHPECLCSVANGSLASPGLTFNETQASTLLATCGVKTSPELSACITAINPGASPAIAPPSPPSPGGAISPATGNVSKAVAASLKLPLLYLAAGGSIIFSFSSF